MKTNRANALFKSFRRLLEIAVCISYLLICLWVTMFNIENIKRPFALMSAHPLEPATVKHLCETFQLEPTSQPCQANGVHAEDFFQDLHLRYQKLTPRQVVDTEIGKYLANCDNWTPTASDGIFQTCYYDFQGDGIQTVRITYQHGTYQYDITELPTDSSEIKVWDISMVYFYHNR